MSPEYRSSRTFWKNRLEQVNDAFSFRQLRSAVIATKETAVRYDHTLSEEVYQSIRTKMGDNDTGIFVYLLAAVGVLLRKYSGNQTLIINSPAYALGNSGQAHVPVVPLVLRSAETVKSYLAGVKEMVKESYSHQDFPLQLLDNRSTAYSNVLISAEAIHLPVAPAVPHDLEISICRNEGLSISISYQPAAFEAGFISNMCAHLERVLRTFARPGLRLEDIDILSAAEREQLLVYFNHTYVASTTHTFQELFERQVKKTPYATAVVFEEISLSYQELNEQANTLAHHLRELHDIRPNDRVGLLLNRSERMIIALLGILKAGAAFLPIDTSTPAGRISGILQDAGVRLLLTDSDQSQHYTNFAGTSILLDEQLSALPQRTENPLQTAAPSDLAYVLYTSGSTGKPKGVMVGNDNLCHYVQWANSYYFNNILGKTFALCTNISFDLTITSIFTTLLRGDQLYVCANKDIGDILQELFGGRTGVNTVKLTPAHISMLSALPLQTTRIQHVILGGETLTAFQVKTLQRLNPEINIYNEYGPTEITVGCTIKKVSDVTTDLATVGTPIANTQVYILDGSLQLLPVGVVGEICIGGKGVTKGYLHRDDLTSEKFVDDPFAKNNAAKIYRTGDMGRWTEDGELVFLGRRDNQVKIRGYRVELGEIETALLDYPGIKDAVVMAVDQEQGNASLAAWFIAERPVDIAQLKAALSNSLPAYMIPTCFTQMDRFPVNTNGKVERAALPLPGAAAGHVAYEAPATTVETLLVQAFQQVLDKEQIGVLDDFFETGGDSIKAMQIASQLYEAGYRLEVRNILANPTIRQLAPVIKPLDKQANQHMITGELPLTPIQHQFFDFPRKAYHHFNFGLLFFSKDRLEEAMLRAVFSKLQEHHDALRITFDTTGPQIIQYNHGRGFPLSLEVYDYVSLPNGVTEMSRRISSMQGEIDLRNGPLLKLGLFHLADGDRLALIVHHLVMDVVSLRIIFEDLGTLFRQYTQGRALSLPKKTDAFKVWSEELQVHANSTAFLQELSYWKKLLAKRTATILPDIPEGSNLVKDSATQDVSLGISATELLLTAVNSRFNTEINDILLTALALSMEQTFGIRTCMVLMEGHGRESILDGVNVNRTVGYFTSVYPVIVTAAGDDLSAVIAQNRQWIHDIPNKGVGYGILKYLTAAEYKQGIDLSKSPQVVFNYFGQLDQDFAQVPFRFSKEGTGEIQDTNEQREHELYITGVVEGKEFSLRVDYSGARFHAATIAAFLENYKLALHAVIEHCCAAVAV